MYLSFTDDLYSEKAFMHTSLANNSLLSHSMSVRFSIGIPISKRGGAFASSE